ncbi:endonuclease [Pyrobaculum ferrireducens]|uniref:endonuclease n=2 Tax=Pyrobaculum TaxID=2276 RepID=UPI0011E540B9|nr:endonuclease [Pyrobaculum ferrireducens]
MGARFERYVLDLLPAIGLIPKATRFKVYREGVEVGEVDIIAVDEKGNTYAIEVKAGRVDISGIRQAYVNAKILGARPLVIARGYADDGARQLAKELGVEVVLLPDYIFLSIDDLYTALTSALARFIATILAVYITLGEKEIEAIKECRDLQCICEKVDCESLFQKLPREAKNAEVILLAIELRRWLPILCSAPKQRGIDI